MQTEKGKKGRGRPRGRANQRGTSRRRSMQQRTRYAFVSASKKTALYRDYFTPTPDVEKRILKLADMVKFGES